MTEPDTLTAAAAELSRLLVEEESLESTLERVSLLALRAFPTSTAAGVTLQRHGRWYTAASSEAWLRLVDEGQYADDDGPCLRAAREQRPVRADETALKSEWDRFHRAALAHDIRSVLALPLRSGDGLIGALNLYSELTDGFATVDEDLAAMYAAQASVALRNTMVYEQAQSLAGQMQEAMASRAVIEQAKGFLMARHDLDADAAFDLLRRASQRSNRKLRDIAADVLAARRGSA